MTATPRAAAFLKAWSDLRYLQSTGAPKDVILAFGKSRAIRPRLERTYAPLKRDFAQRTCDLSFSTDWFSGHIPHWAWVIDEYALHRRPRIEALELGSFEGRSSHFILSQLPNASLTCVDAWSCLAYADRGRSDCDQSKLDAAELAFGRNLLAFEGRYTKRKMRSIAFFAQSPPQQTYDLIYLDGSHHADDVLLDSVCSFERLRVGGLLIFDDYLWKFFPSPRDNPAAAIHALLSIKKGSYRVVYVGYQLVIEKTAT